MNSEDGTHLPRVFGLVEGSGLQTGAPGLWNPGPEHRELRRPILPIATSYAAATMAETSGLEDITKTSNLSAEAQEFYPRGYQAGGSAGYATAPTQHVEHSLAAHMHHQYPSFPAAAPQALVSPAAWGMPYAAAAAPQYMDVLQQQQQQQFMMAAAAAVAAQQQELVRNNYAAANYINHHQQHHHNTQTTTTPTPNSVSTPWTAKQNSSPTEQLRSAMHELTLNPGEFDNLVMPLGDTFCQWLAEPEVIQSAISLILEQSISEPNFRYNGARLLNLLNNLDTSADGSAFRNLLLEKCRQENNTVRTLLESNPRRLHSFTLFLAELFIQLELKKGSGCKISVLGEGLFEDLGLLLSQVTDDNIKCACQVLKLAGMHLEQEVSSASMDKLESQLETAMSGGSLAPNMRTLAQSVLNLRRHAWGRSPPSPAHPPQWSSGQDAQQPQSNHFLNEPVLYGPDGQMLTAEESRFLQDGLNAEEMGGSDGGSDEYDDGMDEELQAAYEQFLQMTPHST